jgi:hypothetical protein
MESSRNSVAYARAIRGTTQMIATRHDDGTS